MKARSGGKARHRGFVPTVALAFFGVQMVVPAALWGTPKDESPSDFSWDMFSYRVHCPTLIAGTVEGKDRAKWLPFETLFSKSAHLRRVLYPERIEALAAYLCPKLNESSSEHVQLRLWIECQYDPNAPPVPLSNRSRDYCAER